MSGVTIDDDVVEGVCVRGFDVAVCDGAGFEGAGCGFDFLIGGGVAVFSGATEAAGAAAATVGSPEGPGTDEKSVSGDEHPASNNPDNNIKGTKDFMPNS